MKFFTTIALLLALSTSAFAGHTRGIKLQSPIKRVHAPERPNAFVILFTRKHNCPACKQVEPAVAEAISEGVPIVEVTDEETTRRFGIRRTPTFVGIRVFRSRVGVISKKEIQSLIAPPDAPNDR